MNQVKIMKKLLKKGDRGPDVIFLQKKLNTIPDGIFGPMTEKAVFRYQLEKDLKVDGILTLTDGVISTGSNKIVISATMTGAVVGGSTTAFINGTLRRYIPTSTGTYSFHFPYSHIYILRVIIYQYF